MNQDKRLEKLIAYTYRLRREELLLRLRRLKEREQNGFGYRKVRRPEVKVRAHTRKAHWAIIPVRDVR